MTTCSIKWCGKNTRLSSYKKDGLTFHRFPKEEERRVQWAKACARGPNWRTPRKALICSRHFEKKFFSIKNRVRLTSDAVPTLLIPRVEELPEYEDSVEEMTEGDTETEGEEEESDSNASETLGTMRPKVDDMTA